MVQPTYKLPDSSVFVSLLYWNWYPSGDPSIFKLANMTMISIYSHCFPHAETRESKKIFCNVHDDIDSADGKRKDHQTDLYQHLYSTASAALHLSRGIC